MIKKSRVSIVIFIIFILAACATPHKYGEREGWSAAMHFKVAQDTANRKAYKQALIEYDEILEKFADQFQYVAEAQYEQSVILYRMKRYRESYDLLTTLKEQLADPNIFWPSTSTWLKVMVPIMHAQVSTHVYKAQEKERVAKEKAEQKAEAKAQRERVKELERARKAREKEERKANQSVRSIAPSDDPNIEDKPKNPEEPRGSVQAEQDLEVDRDTNAVDTNESKTEQDADTNDQASAPSAQDEWETFEPFLPLV